MRAPKPAPASVPAPAPVQGGMVKLGVQCNLGSDCSKNCEDTAYYDATGQTNLNKDVDENGILLELNKTTDAEKCKTFCKKEYPTEAKYFSWVDGKRTSFGQRYKNTCWCRTKDAIKNGEKTNPIGTTTGVTCTCFGKECQQNSDCCDGMTCSWALVNGRGEAMGTLFPHQTKRVCLAEKGNACEKTMDCYGAENNTGEHHNLNSLNSG